MTDTPLNELVASEIRAWLGRRRLTGRQLAAKMGTSQTWTATRLRGEQEISVNDLERFAAALDVEVAQLLPTPALRNSRGGSLQLTRPATPIRRTAVARVARGTPNLTKRPTTQPINRPDREPVAAGGTDRPRVLPRPSSGGDPR